MDRAEVIRLLSLYLPVALAGLLWAWRRPRGRAAAGVVLAFLWNLPALLLVHLLAVHYGWWSFEAESALLLGFPVDLYLGWAVLWGLIPALAFPRLSLAIVVLVMLWLDLLLMPAIDPVVQLGSTWVRGEALALAICLVPAQLLARWTAGDRRLAGRALLGVVAFAGLALGVLPAVVLEQTGGSWGRLVTAPAWRLGLELQLVVLAGFVGLSAVQEFVERGGGTPLPFDPPRRIVTSGLYAYVRNPMQLSLALVFPAWGLVLGSGWVAAGGLIVLIYGAGFGAWDEATDLAERGGAEWLHYRRAVRSWLPRWRPYRPALKGAGDGPGPAPARLYVASNCEKCSVVGDWFERRHPVGLSIASAESFPGPALHRITYDAGDASTREEGIAAVARGLEHIHFGYALAGAFLRLPGVCALIQVLFDASGAEPMLMEGSSKFVDEFPPGD